MRVPDVERERASFAVQGVDLDAVRQAVMERLHQIDPWSAWVVHDMHVHGYDGFTWYCDVEAEARDPREAQRPPRRWFRRSAP